MSVEKTGVAALRSRKQGKKRYILLLMALPFMGLIVMFNYMPLFGWIYAFFDYKPGIPLFQNEFVGFKFFLLFLTDKLDMFRVMKNTLIFAGIGLLISPLPMLFAVLLNEVRVKSVKRIVQTVTTLPHFVSWVIVFSLSFTIFSTDGLLNNVLMSLGLIQKPTSILANADAVYWFQTVLGQWKGLGWSAIVYLASISGIDQELYEAAAIDGAGRLRAAMHITIPSLLPTYIVLFLLGIGNFLNVGFEQYFIYRNPITANNIEVIDVYVYRMGLVNQAYSYGVAIGIMKSFVSVSMLFIANWVAKRTRGSSII